MKKLFYRTLAAALGLYLALNMGRAALDGMEALRQAAALRQELYRIETEIGALEQFSRSSEQTLRLLAFRRAGLVGPEDVVFFDGGSDRKNKGG